MEEKKKKKVPVILIIAGISVLLCGGLAVLSTIIILAINPAGNFAKARNEFRKENVEIVAIAVQQSLYDTDYDQAVFAEIAECSRGSNPLLTSSPLGRQLVDTYLAALPTDPNAEDTNLGDTGYAICLEGSELIIFAPLAEDEKIFSTVQLTKEGENEQDPK